MAIRGDSFSTTTAVLAVTRSFLDGQTAFNTTTRPTKVEVEGFIDEASGHVNIALRKYGFSPANVRANSTAKLAFDSWVRVRAAEFVELAQPAFGFAGQEGQARASILRNLGKAADEFVKMNALGLKREGITVSDPTSEGLAFTGLAAQSERTDPDDVTRAQPKFSRGQFEAD